MAKAARIQTQERSKTKHKSGKLSTRHSGKSKSTKVKAAPRCRCCNKEGHTATKCPMPKKKKRNNFQLIDWVSNDDSDIMLNGRKKQKTDCDLIEW